MTPGHSLSMRFEIPSGRCFILLLQWVIYAEGRDFSQEICKLEIVTAYLVGDSGNLVGEDSWEGKTLAVPRWRTLISSLEIPSASPEKGGESQGDVRRSQASTGMFPKVFCNYDLALSSLYPV